MRLKQNNKRENKNKAGNLSKSWKSYILKTIMIVLLVVIVLRSSTLAVLPLEVVNEKNANAEEVLVGTVVGIYDAPGEWALGEYRSNRLKYFDLKINQVEKTTKGLQKGTIVKIVFIDYEENGKAPHGTYPIRVEPLKRMKIYANSTKLGDNIFYPVLDDFSIIYLGYNYYLMIMGVGLIGILIGLIYLIGRRRQQIIKTLIYSTRMRASRRGAIQIPKKFRR